MNEKLYFEVFENEPGVRAIFSTMAGGHAGGEGVNPNTIKAADLSGRPVIIAEQVHSDNIVEITKAPEALDILNRTKGITEIPGADGLITNVSNILISTVHGDCLPVYLYDSANHAIGMVHSGWRGTLAGIAPKAVRMMEERYGSRPEKMKVYIGPGIGKCCFQVDADVYEAFREKYDFTDSFTEKRGSKYYVDTREICRRSLEETGAADIEVSRLCTYCEKELLGSFRRQGRDYIRMRAFITLE